MDKTRRAIQKYADAAADLAESVKRNIVHEGVIDDETVVKLNTFIIASNEISDMLSAVDDFDNDPDGTLN